MRVEVNSRTYFAESTLLLGRSENVLSIPCKTRCSLAVGEAVRRRRILSVDVRLELLVELADRVLVFDDIDLLVQVFLHIRFALGPCDYAFEVTIASSGELFLFLGHFTTHFGATGTFLLFFFLAFVDTFFIAENHPGSRLGLLDLL